MEAKLRQMKEAFCLFDRDADGLIHAKDFPLLLRCLGVNPTPQEVDDLLKEKSNSMLKFDDIVELAAPTVERVDAEAELLKALKTFDREGDGFISSAELKHVMLSLGERLSEQEVQELISLGDRTGSGRVDYAAFVKQLIGTAPSSSP